MYETYYNLKEMPFSISTDPRFIWWGKKHREAMANLHYGLLKTNGYVVLTGDVGTGKTTMLNALIESLDEQVETAVVNNPTLSPVEFFNLVSHAYGLSRDIGNKADFLFQLDPFLKRARAEGKTVLLIIDEAHCLSEELLEEIRLLSNMETKGRNLLTIFFVGQNEFEQMITGQRYRSLRQRITLFYEIKPLTMQETAAYIRHRLRVAGMSEKVFMAGAERLIFRFTNGYPRLINILCDRAMLTGYVQDCRTIDRAIIEECSREIDYLISGYARSDRYRLLETVSHMRDGVPDLTEVRKQKREVSAGAGGGRKEKQEKDDAIPYPDNGTQLDPVEHSQRGDSGWRRSGLAGMVAVMAILTLVAGFQTVFSGRDEERGVEPQTSSGGGLAGEPHDADSPADVEAALKEQVETEQAKAPAAIPAVAGQPDTAVAGGRIPPAAARESKEGPLSPDASEEAEKVSSIPAEKVASISTEKVASIPAEKSPERQEKPAPADEPASKEEPDRPTPLQRASLALDRQQFDKAKEIITGESGISKEEERQYREVHAKALFGLARQRFDSAPQESVRLLRQAAELAPDMERVHFQLGKLLTGLQDDNGAIAAYETVLALNPESVDALFNLGFLFARTGKYAQAEKSFARVVENTPPYLDKALFNLALVQQRQGKRQQSIEHLRRAVEVEPNNTRAREYLQRMVGEETAAR